MKLRCSVISGKLAQAALFAVILGGAGVQTAVSYTPNRLPDSLVAAIRGSSRTSDGSTFHDPQRPEPRLERTRSTAAQPFAAGLPASHSARSPLPAQTRHMSCGHAGRLTAGLFDTRLARAPPSPLS